MQKTFLLCATIGGALAVVLGAFGAHGLKARVTPAALASYEVGVRYQFYHVLALLAVAWLIDRGPSVWLTSAGVCFVAGIVLFSGSIYLLATRSLLGIESWKWLGPVTPVGGLCFIVGWLLLTLGVFKQSWPK